jgi:hypothetical protein
MRGAAASLAGRRLAHDTHACARNAAAVRRRGGGALFAMMLLTFADVFSRKFLGNSITGAVELTELLMLVMIFCAAAGFAGGRAHRLRPARPAAAAPCCAGSRWRRTC